MLTVLVMPVHVLTLSQFEHRYGCDWRIKETACLLRLLLVLEPSSSSLVRSHRPRTYVKSVAAVDDDTWGQDDHDHAEDDDELIGDRHHHRKSSRSGSSRIELSSMSDRKSIEINEDDITDIILQSSDDSSSDGGETDLDEHKAITGS